MAEIKLNIEKTSEEDDHLMGKYGESDETKNDEEVIQSPSVRTEQIFEKMDSNKDGVITENGIFLNKKTFEFISKNVIK